MSIYTETEVKLLNLIFQYIDLREIFKTMRLWQYFDLSMQKKIKSIITYDGFDSIPIKMELLLRNVKNFDMKDELEAHILFDKVFQVEIDKSEFWGLIDDLKTEYYKSKIVPILINEYEKIVSSKSELDVTKSLSIISDSIATVLAKKSLSTEEKEADIQEIRRRLDNYYTKEGVQRRFKTGFPTIDNNLGGLSSGELSVFMGASGSGKTMLLINLALNIWKYSEDANVAFYSLEMPIFQIMRRIDSKLLSLQYDDLKFGKIDPNKIPDEVLSDIEKKKNMFKVIDVPPKTPMYKIEEYFLGLDRRPDVLVIDYIGLIGGKVSMERWQILSEAALYMKYMAKKYDIAVVTASQVTTEAQKRKNAFEEGYQLYDLSGARAIGDHSDLVVSINYDPNLKIMSLSIAKYRDGQKLSFSLFVDYSKCSIYELQNS